MIIVTVKQTDHGRWETTVTDMDGTPVRNPDGTRQDRSHTGPARAWERVGELIDNAPGGLALVRTVDARQVDARPRHSAIDSVVRGHREN